MQKSYPNVLLRQKTTSYQGLLTPKKIVGKKAPKAYRARDWEIFGNAYFQF